MSSRKTVAAVLRTAAYLLCIDGWNPTLGVEMRTAPYAGRFYRPSTLVGAVIRAYQVLNCKWMDMVRAGVEVQRLLGLRDDDGVRAWERAPGRTQDEAERILLRAAWRLEHA